MEETIKKLTDLELKELNEKIKEARPFVQAQRVYLLQLLVNHGCDIDKEWNINFENGEITEVKKNPSVTQKAEDLGTSGHQG